MNERLRRWMSEAQHGDLRPQINPATVVNATSLTSADVEALKPVLIDRFLQLARPIADASAGGGPEMRLRDAGPFFYLIETLKRLGYDQLEQTLCILLDEFAQLDERSYDELYLWCIVELSRTDPRHVDVYWPQVLTLDRRYRAELWRRPEGVPVVEQPYRLTELLFYFYLLYTLKMYPPCPPPIDFRALPDPRLYLPACPPPPTLGSHLKRLAPQLGGEAIEIARRALEALEVAEPRRPAFGDALGLLPRRKRAD